MAAGPRWGAGFWRDPPPQVPCLTLAHMPNAMEQTVGLDGTWLQKQVSRRAERNEKRGPDVSWRGAGPNRDAHPALTVSPPLPPAAGSRMLQVPAADKPLPEEDKWEVLNPDFFP